MDEVSGGSWDVADDGDLSFYEFVEDGAFADVGLAEDGDFYALGHHLHLAFLGEALFELF